MRARARTLALPLLALLLAVAVVLAPTSTARPAPPLEVTAGTWPPPTPTIVAHRCNGAGYTEETVVACVRAAATGATTLDVDVRFASTGTPVALHDPDLGLFGRPDVLVSSLGWTPAAQYVSPAGQNLATLRQIRDVATAAGTDLSIEPKVRPTAAQWAAIDTALGSLKSRTLVNSFDPLVVTDALARGFTRVSFNSYTAGATPPAGTPVVTLKGSKITAAEVDRLLTSGVRAVWCFQCEGGPAVWDPLLSVDVTGFSVDDHDAAEVWVASLYTS